MNRRVRYGLFRLALIALLAVTGFANVAPSVFAADALPGAADVDGDLDSSFGTGGKVTTDIGSDDEGNAVVIQADGKVVVGGTDGANFVITRYKTNGELHTTFNADGKVTTNFRNTAGGNKDSNDRIHGLAIDANGFIVAAGTSGNDLALARYDSNGELDTTFNPTGDNGDLEIGKPGIVTTDFNKPGTSFTNAEGQAVAIDPNGKIVIVGYVQNGSEKNDFLVARYNTDDGDDSGKLDTDFNSGGSIPGVATTSVQQEEDDQAYAVAVQPNGKIVVVGDTKGAPGIFVMLRYNSNGSIDTGFGTNGIAYAASQQVSTGRAIALQSDGKIVVAGAKYVNGCQTDPQSQNCIDSNGKFYEYLDFWVARFNSDGEKDNSFGTAGEMATNINSRGNDDQGRGVAIQPDGKIIVAGHADVSIHTFSGEDEFFSRTDDFALARYTSNGTLDTTFGTNGTVLTDFFNSSYDEAFAVALEADGKIVAAGVSDKNFAVARYGTSTQGNDTTTTLTSSLNPSKFGELVTFTATVSAASGPPTGDVFFSETVNGVPTLLGTIQLSNGTAAFTTSSLSIGQHDISATYDGDGNFNGSTSNPVLQMVTDNTTSTTTTLTSTPNPSKVEEAVTFMAMVEAGSGTPTGRVLFQKLGVTLPDGDRPLTNGMATLTTNTLLAGQHQIRATYIPSGNFAGSVSNFVNQTVAKQATTFDLRSSMNPADVDDDVKFTACLLPQSTRQTGTITPYHEDGALGPPTPVVDLMVDGAPCRGISFEEEDDLTPGKHSIRVEYSGDSRFSAGTSPILEQFINGKRTATIALRTSQSPATVGTKVTLTAHAFPDTGLQSGDVTFFDGASALGTVPLVDCQTGGIPCQEATFETSTLTVGNHTLTAQYDGGSTFFPATSPPVDQKITVQPVAPVLPITLRVASSNTAMKLDWNVINDPGVTGYRILRSAGLNDTLAVLEQNWIDPAYLDNKDLLSGFTYCYVVEARRSNDTLAATSARVCAEFGGLDLWIPNAIGRPGETTPVQMNIRNADGLRITSSDIWMEFNGDIIESVGISRTALTANYQWSSFVQDTPNPPTKRMIIAYIDLNPQPLQGSGSLFLLNFKVRGQPGQDSPLDLKEFITNVGGSSIQDISDPGEDVPLKLTDGVFSVKEPDASYIRGDIDGDGVVRAADAALALRLATRTRAATAQELAAGDVNGDGVISAADSSMILYYATRLSWPLPSAPLASTETVDVTTHNGVDTVVRLNRVEASPGTTVAVTLSGEVLDETAGGTFEIAYDIAVVKSVVSVTKGDLVADFKGLDYNDDGSGLLAIALSNDTDVSGSGELVTIEFELQSDAPLGASPLTLANAVLNDSFGRDFVTSFADNTLTRRSGEIDVVDQVTPTNNSIYLPIVSK